ncbi:MAG: T9SS type A sorting domain-containing protein [Bacteroidota bacterium]
MRATGLLLLFFLPGYLLAQKTNGPDNALGAKPIISVNGITCNILNQQFSCTPRVCDAVLIAAGDSIEFCTVANISLTTDTNYYMQWNFNGSSSHTIAIYDSFPTATPICYYPKWSVAGDYTVDIFYNGWLSAYPYSDCWAFGPSHWIINVQVIPTGVTGIGSGTIAPLYPNPGDENVTVTYSVDQDAELQITDISGKTMLIRKLYAAERLATVNCSSLDEGVYFCRIVANGQAGRYQKLIIAR